MTYSYFPGCTLKNKAKDLDHYARECAKVLGFELEEIENWQCCGAVYPQASDEIATKLSSVRALADAKEKGQDLITVCSACHHVIKRVNDDMANVEDIQTKVNNYMALSEPYLGETKYFIIWKCCVTSLDLTRSKRSGKPIKRKKNRRILRLYAASSEHHNAV